jgi:transcriptional regulator with XRE-family HTH domain
MPSSDVEALLQVLRTAMRILGVRHRELARRLGVQPSYLSRLFNGQIELKVDHLLNLVQGVGLQPDEFFRLAYPLPTNPPTEAASALRGLLPATPASEASPAAPVYTGPSEEEINSKVEETVRRIFREMGKAAG